jgi:dihydroxy-acid dehydratase
VGVDLKLDDLHHNSAGIPLLVNLQPSGKYFMEDFYYAGGLPVVMKELADKLHGDRITANGKTVRENYEGAQSYNDDVITGLQSPYKTETGLAVLYGNLCANGAVIKPSAASKHLMKHTGKAVVFENIEDYHARVDDPNLDVDENSVLVLKNVGPVGYPGMPEVGNMAVPKKVLEKGIHDMVRISDGRMSGTGFGTVVLHVSPEAAKGGTLALVQDGDLIALDVENRSLELLVGDEELNNRRAAWKPSHPEAKRGYVQLYQQHVEQAHLGADMDFLRGCSGSKVTRDSH